MAGYFLSLIGMLSLNLYAVVYEDLPEINPRSHE